MSDKGKNELSRATVRKIVDHTLAVQAADPAIRDLAMLISTLR